VGEGDGAGEESFAEDFDGEGAGASARAAVAGDEFLDGFAEGVESRAEGDFLGCELEYKCLGFESGAESGWVGACVDFAFEAANDDLLDAAAFGVAELVGLAEADGIEDFEETGEAAGVSVVRCGAEEEAVFELWADETEHATEVTVVTEGGGHEVVAFVENEQVPWEVRGAFGSAAGGEELFEDVILTEVVVGGDDAAEGSPGVGVHSESAAEGMSFVAVDEVELEREFVPHFVAPLEAECGGGEDEDALDAASEEEFSEDESGFDGFTESDVVSEEEADAGHAEGFEEGDELEVVDLNGAVEGAGEG
jgi:hypothetical protein